MMTTNPPGISEDMAAGLRIVTLHNDAERTLHGMPPGPDRDRADGIAEGLARALGVLLGQEPIDIRSRVQAAIEPDVNPVERARRALAAMPRPPGV